MISNRVRNFPGMEDEDWEGKSANNRGVWGGGEPKAANPLRIGTWLCSPGIGHHSSCLERDPVVSSCGHFNNITNCFLLKRLRIEVFLRASCVHIFLKLLMGSKSGCKRL